MPEVKAFPGREHMVWADCASVRRLATQGPRSPHFLAPQRRPGDGWSQIMSNHLEKKTAIPTVAWAATLVFMCLFVCITPLTQFLTRWYLYGQHFAGAGNVFGLHMSWGCQAFDQMHPELVCRHMPCAGAWCNGNGNAMNAWTGEMNPILWLDRWLPYFVTLEFWCQPSACSWAWGFEICCLSSCESFQCLEGYSKKPRAQEFSCQAGPGHPVRSRDEGPWGMAPRWPHGLGSWKHGQVIAKGCRGNTRWIDTDMTQEHVLNMTRNHTCGPARILQQHRPTHLLQRGPLVSKCLGDVAWWCRCLPHPQRHVV